MSLPPEHFIPFPGFELINGSRAQGGYGTLPPVNDPRILELFSMTQVGTAANFHGHPVILMVVNYMQKRHDWEWRDKNAYRKLFPGLDLGGSPDSMTIERPENSRLNAGGDGLLAKAFYNADQERKRLKMSRANSEVSDLNNYLRDNAAFLYAEYFRHAYRIAPSGSMVEQYLSLLQSNAYRTLKQGQEASGTWSNAELEMYTHFVKLLACGASQAEVGVTYRLLTTTDPILNPSAFRAITDTKWTSYRGWLAFQMMDYGNLNAKNLDASYFINRVVYKIVQRFAHFRDYWESSGGSCFAAGTQVMLSDRSSKDIEMLQTGEKIISSLFGGEEESEGEATVMFVSRIKRKDRNLFSFTDRPSIKFTATHPLVTRHGAQPQLSFVDPDRARTVNLTWESIPAKRLSPEELVVHPPDKNENEDESVYDLVLDHPAGSLPRTYTVVDPNGGCIETMSEAPIFEWFPYAAKFFEGYFTTFQQSGQEIPSLLNLLEGEDFDVNGALDEAIKEVRIQGLPNELLGHKESGSAIVSRLLNGPAVGSTSITQDIADTAEKLTWFLGRQINNEISAGWLNNTPGDGKEDPNQSDATTTALVIYSLNALDYSTATQARIDNFKEFDVYVSQSGVGIGSMTVNGTIRGWQTFEVGQGIEIPEASASHDDGVNVFTDMNLIIRDVGAEITYYGGGPMHEGVETRILLGSESGEYMNLEAKVKRVHKAALKSQSNWGEVERATFAKLMGDSFAKKVADALKAPSGE